MGVILENCLTNFCSRCNCFMLRWCHPLWELTLEQVYSCWAWSLRSTLMSFLLRQSTARCTWSIHSWNRLSWILPFSIEVWRNSQILYKCGNCLKPFKKIFMEKILTTYSLLGRISELASLVLEILKKLASISICALIFRQSQILKSSYLEKRQGRIKQFEPKSLLNLCDWSWFRFSP